VGFVYDGATLGSTRLQQFLRSSQDILDATGHPHIQTLTVTGPYNATGPGKTASRNRIFVCDPRSGGAEAPTASAEHACAERILVQLARRGYRGADTPEDVATLLDFYEAARARGSFEAGIQAGVERLLSSPKFLFRIERVPESVKPGFAYSLPDVELASRLAFFLWSSLPDDELLDLARGGKLAKPEVFKAQVVRMLADAKARALVDNFAAQ